ncbi:RusA family crossover junction endodeoxyribonuclease [Virgibacillus salexigens]|uniref:Holliday junction resolvase n=1 Tax=Virgibacillus massiliensis TaxID=1462526 RepID=A0A024QHS0_9BACI|nr:RusA family crossover junction endodeoxyribonuclease [Virgibacillus massiliensis]CDQ41760.1 Holliday junction resolvase [Virgibacillus massiliensis]
MYEKLILPMMMFGKFRSTKPKKDKNGKTMKNNKGNYIREKCWVYHDENNGDPGVYPSVNHIYERMAKGRQRLTKPAQELSDKWADLAKMWVRDNEWNFAAGKVVLELTAYFPNDNRKRDTHNAFKLMMDALEDIIYENDSLALPRVIDFHKVKNGENPYFELNIYKKDKENEVMQNRYRTAS